MIVVDSSTMIVLAKAGLLDSMLESARAEVAIPQEVLAETTAKKELFDAQLIHRRVSEKKLVLRTIRNRERCRMLARDFNIGAGEAEAITLCLEQNATLMSDDKKAMNACRVLRIPFTTAPNVLVALYRKRRLSREQAQQAAQQLILYGRYSSELIHRMKEDLQ